MMKTKKSASNGNENKKGIKAVTVRIPVELDRNIKVQVNKGSCSIQDWLTTALSKAVTDNLIVTRHIDLRYDGLGS